MNLRPLSFRFGLRVAAYCMSLSVLLILGVTGTVWAGRPAQTIPTVTATVAGQPPVVLPDGLIPDNPGETQADAAWFQYGVWPIGCCLLLCIIGLIPLGVFFNIWARRRRRQPTQSTSK